jgi:hypothetical protein
MQCSNHNAAAGATFDAAFTMSNSAPALSAFAFGGQVGV